MDQERRPKDLNVAALVALVLADIHEFDHTDRDVLLAAFLDAAWPSERARSQ